MVGGFLVSRFQFDRFEALAASRQLLMDGTPVALGGRAFDLLLCLIEHRDRLVSKEELMAAVWPGLVVTENNLNAQAATLRRLLGPQALVTVTGRGYRFGLEVLEIAEPAATWPGRSSIAVLPFQNMSGDPEQEYFADGMAEDVITALSRFKQLTVIARNSSFTFKNRAVDVRVVGKELGVRYVLEGSVRKAARRLRMTVQLIDTTNGSHLWADRFDGDVEDVFDFQDDITAKVVAAIEPAIRKVEIEHSRRKRPGNLDAYDLYLRALPHLYAMRPEDNSAALALLEQALSLDPHFALALAHAAWCYEQRLMRVWSNAEEGQRPIAVALARRALAEDSNDANVVGLAGFVLSIVGKDFEAGLAALRRAVALNPNNALVSNFAGTANLCGGSLGEALTHLERAQRLSPSDPAAFMFITAQALVHLLAGRYAKARALATESAALNPDWELTWMVLGASAAETGQIDRAREAVVNLQRTLPGAVISHPYFLVIADLNRRAILLDGLRKAGLQE